MTFRRDIALFDAGDEGWLDPCAPGFLMGTNKKRGRPAGQNRPDKNSVEGASATQVCRLVHNFHRPNRGMICLAPRSLWRRFLPNFTPSTMAGCFSCA